MSTPDPAEREILRYQQDRPLDQVPGYMVGVQVRLAEGDRVYIARSATELALYFHNDLALHYDLEGRLVKVAAPNEYWRRSLSHRIVHSRKRPADQGGGLERCRLDESAADQVVTDAAQAAQAVWQGVNTGLTEIEFGKPHPDAALAHVRPLLERAAGFDRVAARADAARYRQVYGQVAVLPPDEYNALVLQATQGCSYNHCAFCQLYQDVTYRSRSPEEFREHIRAVAAYHGEARRARRSIFLGEANALTLPQSTLLADLELIHKAFRLPPAEDRHVPAQWWLGQPDQFDGVASFLDCFSDRPRTDFDVLRRRGLRRVYLGMESGADDLLKWLRKPASSATVVATVQALKQAQIAVGVIVLLGAGGLQYADQHVRETTRVLNALRLERGDYVYFSPLVVYAGGQYDAQALARQIKPLTPGAMDAQEQAIRRGLRFALGQSRPYLARYELELFTY